MKYCVNFNSNGGWVSFIPLPYWFSLNGKSCNPGISQHSVTFYQRCSCQIWYSLLAPVSRYWAKLRRGYFRYPDFWSIPYKKKLSSVTKLANGNKTTSKKCDDDVMSENCAVITIFPFYGQFGAIRKPDLGAQSVKLIFSLIVTIYLGKTEKRTYKVLTKVSHYCFE